MKYVLDSMSANSDFVYWLYLILPQEKIRKVVSDYYLGATKKREVIFWEIDTDGNVRTGKTMSYDSENGIIEES